MGDGVSGRLILLASWVMRRMRYFKTRVMEGGEWIGTGVSASGGVWRRTLGGERGKKSHSFSCVLCVFFSFRRCPTVPVWVPSFGVTFFFLLFSFPPPFNVVLYNHCDLSRDLQSLRFCNRCKSQSLCFYNVFCGSPSFVIYTSL